MGKKISQIETQELSSIPDTAVFEGEYVNGTSFQTPFSVIKDTIDTAVGQALVSGPQSFGDNYVITPSVASNNLTVALKTVAGADPSANDKITFRIGNTKREITAALSVTKNAGTNWCNAGASEFATIAIDYFVYVIQETGASAGTKIGFSRIPYARTMNDFVNTSTHEKYIAGSWTNFNATDQVENIGRFRATLSAGAGYTWSIASAVVVNRPVYETDWLTFNPGHPNGGSMTYTRTTLTYAKYIVRGSNFRFEISTRGTTGGTASSDINATLPFKCELAASSAKCAAAVNDSGTGAFSFGYLVSATPDYVACRKPDSSNWGLGTNRDIAPFGEFEID